MMTDATGLNAAAQARIGSASSSRGRCHHHHYHHEPQQQQQNQQNDDIDTRSHLSLAAMSTGDDVSSLGTLGGDTTTEYSLQSNSHQRRQQQRKRKDEGSEFSRCSTANSDDDTSGRSRTRRRRLLSASCQRWQLGDNCRSKPAQSDAPVRPCRSNDAPITTSTCTTSTTGATTSSPAAAPQDERNPHTTSTISESMSRPRSDSAPCPSTTSEARASTTSSNRVSASERRFDCSEAAAREVLRCQSMTRPPVRPTRTRDDSNSNLTLKSDTENDDDPVDDDGDHHRRRHHHHRHRRDEDEDHGDVTDRADEYDPDMFARLLQGQQVVGGKLAIGMMAPGNQPSLSASAAAPGRIGPPQRPRRRSDADSFLYTFQQQQRNDTLIRHHANATATTTTAIHERHLTQAISTTTSTLGRHHDDGSYNRHLRDCPHNNHSSPSLRDSSNNNGHHRVSPKPPALPSRSFDGGKKIFVPQALDDDNKDRNNNDNEASSVPSVRRVSDQSSSTAANNNAAELGMQNILQSVRNEMSSSSRMELLLEQVNEDGEEVVASTEEENFVEQEEEEDQDLTEVSAAASAREYDAELFERLLHGDDASPISATTTNSTGATMPMTATTTTANAMEPPPSLIARVSGNGVATTTSTPCPAYDSRFDNSVPCTRVEHMEGVMKSSHPPMRPRRSVDEGTIVFLDECPVTLGAIAAAACKAHAAEGNEAMSSSDEPMTTTTSKKPVRLVAGKRTYSRRSTLPLAAASHQSSDLDSGNGPSSADGEQQQPHYYYDPTQEANLVASSSAAEEALGEIPDACDEYDHKQEEFQANLWHGAGDNVVATANAFSSSYLRILPIRKHRRMVRRFTMPQKARTLSPLTKKRRVGRSLSCRSSDESMNMPVA